MPLFTKSEGFLLLRPTIHLPPVTPAMEQTAALMDQFVSPIIPSKRDPLSGLGFVPNLDPLFSYTLRVRSVNFGCARHSGHLREAFCRLQAVMESYHFNQWRAHVTSKFLG